MIFTLYTVLIVISTFVFCLVGCFLARYVLSAAQLLDQPNERSNHEIPVPRGGGIAVTCAAIAFLFIAATPNLVLWATAGIAIISFLDDKGDVDIRWRLLIQVLAVTLLFLPHSIADWYFAGPVFQGLLPPLADRLLAGLMLLGFMNIFNFMDGIDGISGVEAIGIGTGIFILTFFAPHLRVLGVEGLVISAAALAFLVLNWHPARLFLGDVGSVPLGFLLGYLLLAMAAKGDWAAALILPAYYLTDGGLTLLKRLLSGQKIWEAHSEHAYQRAVRAGWPHDWVASRIAVLNFALILLAAIACLWSDYALFALGGAYITSLGLWGYLRNTRKPPAQTVLTPQGDVLSA